MNGCERDRIELRLSRGAGVSLRRQLSAGMAARIRDQALPPGARLPSVRRLAAHLGVHRNTVVASYRELAAAKLVIAVEGRGVYVVDRAPEDAWGRFVLRATGEGVRAVEIADGVASWARTVSSGRLLLIEPSRTLREPLAREVYETTGCRVIGVGPGSVLSDPGPARSSVPLARPGVLDRLAPTLDRWQVPLPLELSGGSAELRAVRALRPGSVVGLVSASRLVRRSARALLAASGCDSIGFATPEPADRRALTRTVRIAALLFADAICAELPELRGERRLRRLHLLSRPTRARLRAFFASPKTGVAPGDPGARNLFEWKG